MKLQISHVSKHVKKFTCFLKGQKTCEKNSQVLDSFSTVKIHMYFHINDKKRSHTQLDSRKQVIAFQDRVITINIKEAQHSLK